MEKELLERRKVALKKLLRGKRHFCSGLCNLIYTLQILNILTLEECVILDELIDSYFKENEEVRNTFRRYGGFMWERGKWEPREQWVLSTIKEINCALNKINYKEE